MQALEAKGLAGVMADLIDATGGTTEMMQIFIPQVEALTPALALAKDEGQAFTEIMKLMEDRAGATQEAFDEVAVTFTQNLNSAVQGFVVIIERSLIPVIEALTPVLAGITVGLLAIIDNMDTFGIVVGTLAVFLSRNLIAGLVGVATSAVTTAARTAALNYVFTTGTTASYLYRNALFGLRAAFAGLSTFLLANPLGVAIIAFGAIATALSLIGDRSERVDKLNKNIADSADKIKTAYEGAETAAEGMEEALKQVSVTQAEVVFDTAFADYSDGIDSLTDNLSQFRERLITAFDVDTLILSPESESNVISFIDQLIIGLERGVISTELFKSTLDQLNVSTNSAYKTAISRFIDQNLELDKTRENARQAGQNFIALGGNIDDATTFMLRIGEASETTALQIEVGADQAGTLKTNLEGARTAAEALASLRLGIPVIANFNEVRDKILQARSDTQIILDENQELFDRGIFNQDQLDQFNKNEEENLQRLLDVLRGDVEIDNLANDILLRLQNFERQGNISDLDELEREIADSQERYRLIAVDLKAIAQDAQTLFAVQRNDATRSRDILFGEIQEAGGYATAEQTERLNELDLEIKRIELSGNNAINALRNLNDLSKDLEEKDEKRIRREFENQKTTELTNEVLERRIAIQEELQGGIDGLLERLEDLNFLLEKDLISDGQYAAAILDLNVQLTALNNTPLGGIENGLARIAARANDIGSIFSDYIVNSIDNATNAFVEWARTGEFSVRSFFQTLFAELLRIATNQLIIRFLGDIGLGAIFGGTSAVGTPLADPGIARAINTVPVFAANGARFTVGGTGGTDSQFIPLFATPGEEVEVRTPEQQRRRAAPVVQVSTPVKVEIINNAPGVVHRQEISEGRIRIIADEVATARIAKDTDGAVGRAISDPNSRSSQALTRHTSTGRRFG